MELRERAHCYGCTSLSLAELLSLVLNKSPRHDPLPLAQQMLETYDLKRLRNASALELEQSVGLSPTNALRLAAICELAFRLGHYEQESRRQITSMDDAIEELRPHLAHLDHEEFRVLVLDIKNRVVANLRLYTGTVNSSVLRVAEVFHEAIVRKCPNVLVAHNHPSGDPIPSQEDKDVTRNLLTAGKLLDIDLLDHLIIGNPRSVSLKQLMKW